MSGDALVMGAVAYDPKVVTIWDGFRQWLRGRGLDFDYVLYSNYERQVEELLHRGAVGWRDVEARAGIEAPGRARGARRDERDRADRGQAGDAGDPLAHDETPFRRRGMRGES